MKIGTKSILFGYHQFLIHPLFVALAWWRLFGFPWDPRLWVAFVVHDWGYWGKPDMDGEEGESHPITGARVMANLFDIGVTGGICDFIFGRCPQKEGWYYFTFYHSRFLCKRYGMEPSNLCYADKLAIVITPTWLQLFLMNLTGEIKEYMQGQDGRTNGKGKSQRQWVEEMKKIVRSYLSEQMGTCVECGLPCRDHHYMCDESIGELWCPDCFHETPCGNGAHGEGCPTWVRSMPNEP